jgi:aspartyl-tRNA(Asn)/glutamyl-tRNA(Gln) amidotransferase subunit C
MIKKEEIKHIAKLARLGLSEKELNSMQKNFSAILDYVNTLEKADVSEINNVFEKDGLTNVYRSDEAKETSKEERERLLNSTPERKEDYIKTKKIL